MHNHYHGQSKPHVTNNTIKYKQYINNNKNNIIQTIFITITTANLGNA